MARPQEWRPLTAPALRAAWTGFCVAFVGNAICCLAALGAKGWAAQLFAFLAFGSSVPLQMIIMRLLNHYEGEGHEIGPTGRAIIYGVYVAAMAAVMVELARRGGMHEEVLKTIVFLCLFVNFWGAFGVLAQRDAHPNRKSDGR